MINVEFLDLRSGDLNILAETNVPNTFSLDLVDNATGDLIPLDEWNTFKMFIRKREYAAPLATVNGVLVDDTIKFEYELSLQGINYFNIVFSNVEGETVTNKFSVISGMINFQATQQ